MLQRLGGDVNNDVVEDSVEFEESKVPAREAVRGCGQNPGWLFWFNSDSDSDSIQSVRSCMIQTVDLL